MRKAIIKESRRISFEIQWQANVFAQTFDVAIDDVTPVRAKMRHDSPRAAAFANGGGGNRIGLGVFRFRHPGITRLPQSRDVIDVNRYRFPMN